MGRVSHCQAFALTGTPVEHQGIEAHTSTAPQTQKQNQNGITITSEADRWRFRDHPCRADAASTRLVSQWPARLVDEFCLRRSAMDEPGDLCAKFYKLCCLFCQHLVALLRKGNFNPLNHVAW